MQPDGHSYRCEHPTGDSLIPLISLMELGPQLPEPGARLRQRGPMSEPTHPLHRHVHWPYPVILYVITAFLRSATRKNGASATHRLTGTYGTEPTASCTSPPALSRHIPRIVPILHRIGLRTCLRRKTVRDRGPGSRLTSETTSPSEQPVRSSDRLFLSPPSSLFLFSSLRLLSLPASPLPPPA